MQSVRIHEIPAQKMVSSGMGMFDEPKFDCFECWLRKQPRDVYPKDLMYWGGAGFIWLYKYTNGMEVPPEFDIIDFEGGLYAVTTDIDQQTDMDAMYAELDTCLAKLNYERDKARPGLGHIITTPSVREVIGYSQMNYFTPIRKKK